MSTHGLDLGVVLEHDLVLVVDVGELLLGDVDARFRDEEDLALFEERVEPVDGIVEARSADLALARRW
jgi:hypothetical protein